MGVDEPELPTYGEFFPSAWAKIARADRLRRELGEVIDAWQQRDPLTSELEIGDEAAILRVRIREPMPAEVPCIVGDLVHNLRAALDHAVYDCVDQPGDETCQFPSLRDGDAAHFTRSQWAKRVKNAVPVYETPRSRATKLRKLLHSLDPYIGGDHEFIWLLTYLDNVDKHRLVLTLSAAVATTSTVSDMAVTTDLEAWFKENEAVKSYDVVEVPTTESGEPMFKDVDLRLTLRPAHEFPLEDGMEVLRWSGPGWANIREYSMQFDVVLGEPERYAGASLLSNLDITGTNVATMLQHIAEAVYDPESAP